MATSTLAAVVTKSEPTTVTERRWRFWTPPKQPQETLTAEQIISKQREIISKQHVAPETLTHDELIIAKHQQTISKQEEQLKEQHLSYDTRVHCLKAEITEKEKEILALKRDKDNLLRLIRLMTK